jgi:mRNA deadenylase 3'-5' endonuclease subunit Ccr4
LSIVSSKTSLLRYHETHRNHRVAKEYNANGESSSLGLIFRLFDHDVVDKNLVVHLALYLSQESENEKIIRRILIQIVDASKQNTKRANELLLSTILEAALRTLYNLPFIPGQRSFDLQKVLKRFQSEYLTGSHEDKWDTIIVKLSEVYRRLRHRNAHPDWLSAPMGMLSVPALEQTVDDMIFLSRFYGYMILALSGFKDIEPKFPVPTSKWKPIMVMETNRSE